MIRRSLLLGGVALALGFAGVRAGEPRSPSLRVARSAGAEVWSAELEERVLALAIVREGAGTGAIAILAAPSGKSGAKPADEASDPCKPGAPPRDEAPRKLLIFRPRGEGELGVARDDLPADGRDLAAVDLDGDGRDELLLARGDRISILASMADGTWTPGREVLQGTAGLERFAPGALAGRSGLGPPVWFQAVGTLRGYGPEAGGDWKPLVEIPLPVKVEKQEAAFALSSPEIVRIAGGGVPLLGTRPEEWKGADRIRIVGVSVEANPSWGEYWCRLPQPERVFDSKLLRLDGKPFLCVATIPAAKLSIFGEKLLRLCPLEPDRTRAGKAPLLAVESRINVWQEAEPFAADVDGDGREDLVVGYWKGLKDSTVVLDAYLRNPDGSFQPSPKTTSFDVENGDRDFVGYGHDIDGDGRTDLVVRAGGRISLHPGLAGSSGKRCVDPRPRWTVSLATPPGDRREKVGVEIRAGSEGMDARTTGSVGGTIRLLDVDGDGKTEILVQGRIEDRVSVAVIRASRGPGTP